MMFRPVCCLTRLRQQLKPEIDPCQDPSSPSLCFRLGKLSEWLFSCENTSISHPVAIRRTRYISLFSQILPLSRAGRSLGRIPSPSSLPVSEAERRGTTRPRPSRRRFPLSFECLPNPNQKFPADSRAQTRAAVHNNAQVPGPRPLVNGSRESAIGNVAT